MGKSSVIFIEDKIYGKRLLNCITGRGTRQFAIQLIECREELELYIESSSREQMPDLLITDENSFYDEIRNMYSGRIIVLTEEQVSAKQISAMYGDEVIGICRYQAVDDLYHQIVDAAGLFKRRSIGSAEVLGIYSCVNVMQRQAFALSVAKVLSKKYKVIYINLDVFSGLEELLPEKDGGNLSDALYYYRQGRDSAMSKIRDTINSYNGIDYIAPVKCADDINCISVEELTAFVASVAKCNDYEMVILDVYSLAGDVCKLLDVCSNIYMPVTDDYLSVRKLKSFEGYYCETGREDLISSMVKVKLPEGEAQVCKEFWEKIEYGGMYRYVSNLFKIN